MVSPPVTKRVNLGWGWERRVRFGLVILHTKYQNLTMFRSNLKVCGGRLHYEDPKIISYVNQV